MATGTKVCKVCGKTYEYCKTNRHAGIFRWQDVACSKECGAIYFARIQASRESSNEKNSELLKEDSVVENLTDEIIEEQTLQNLIDQIPDDESEDEDDTDELFEEEYDDNDEEPEIES